MERKKHQIRCFCSRKPLLGICGVDQQGRVYVHCRVFKQSRVYGDWIAYGGEVKILCRECFRWHVITFPDKSKSRAVLQETPPPVEVDAPVTVDPTTQRAEAI